MKQNNISMPPLLRKKSFWVALLAALLALSLVLILLITALTAAPAVYDFGGATLREDAYRYWFACYKYVYQIRYKDLEISDTAAGWQAVGEDGRTYEEAFYEVLNEEICMRFIAASIFDSEGYRMAEDYYEELNTVIDELGTELYGEKGFSILAGQYDIGKNAVKQVALYEQKYRALYDVLFADTSAVYAEEYREQLAAFYEKYYHRYNMIHVTNEEAVTLEAALADGVTEEEFTLLEDRYADAGSGITSGNYPNGIYLYAGASYTNAFSAELLSAFSEADAVGKWVKKQDSTGDGWYYVMRYALDKEPYLSEDEKVQNAFADLPTYAASYLYRMLLAEELDSLVSHGVAQSYTVAGTVACRDYNVVRLLGNG